MSTTSTEATVPTVAKGKKPVSPRRFRKDIEGLRAIAIILVLLFHAGVDAVPGGFVGVDVFFVISGFLITGLIYREIQATGRLSLVNFYARRARRLLPATVLVLVTTAALTWLFLPITQRSVFGTDIAAAALYVVNWVLAARSVDYLAEGVIASPVQHFWSLAVEEQYYIIWPLAVLALLHLARRTRIHTRVALLIGIVVLIVPSFIWSVLLTEDSPERAYFVTTTRLWELGVGAAVALALPLAERLHRGASTVLATSGLALIIGSGALLTSDVAWPGWHAAVPVAGAALVIIGGSAGHETPVSRLLSVRPMVWTGSISYSLYLWHWPLLVAAGAYFGEMTTLQGICIALAAFIPAALSLKYIENPVRHSTQLASSPTRTLAVGLACMVIGATTGGALHAPWNLTRDASVADPAGLVGDAALKGHPAGSPWDTTAELPPFLPDPLSATKDVPAVYDDRCQVGDETPKSCTYGDVTSNRTVVLVGDSMATMWQPALDTLGLKYGFRVVTYLKSGCTFMDGTMQVRGEIFTSCREWSDKVLPLILEARPILVVTNHNGYQALEDPTDPETASRPAMVAALSATWSQVNSYGIPVVVVAMNPHPAEEIYECVAQNTDDVSVCTFPAKETTALVQREAASRTPGVSIVDLIDRICPGGECPAVIGGVNIYRQGPHLTKTYVDSVTPVFEDRLLAVAPFLSRD